MHSVVRRINNICRYVCVCINTCFCQSQMAVAPPCHMDFSVQSRISQKKMTLPRKKVTRPRYTEGVDPSPRTDVNNPIWNVVQYFKPLYTFMKVGIQTNVA